MKLWKEYAIEPSLFTNYHLADAILSGIGIEHGRIVGAVPRRWEKEVRLATAELREIERGRIVERLAKLRDAIIPRQCDWNGARTWREQAFEVHAADPFDCILLDGPDAHQSAANATLGLGGVPCWDCSRSLEIPRTAPNLAAAVKPMLCQARTVILVDAYFNPTGQVRQSKWLRPLQALTATLATDGRLSRFEVHALNPREERRRWNSGLFASNCRACLGAALPQGVSVSAFLWSERKDGEQFHERLIVTDIGGVVVDPGIDDGPIGEIYKLRLISKLEVASYLAKFTSAGPYDLVEQEAVSG
ncbi:hypothetical protein [Bradyrhizobium lablabi]|uniref:hypothetical protein n=1 Tax=Bradyrhizobium lablabi TaxID=722472 RepID=UPI001BACD566|nr:hypothetical protein [Bradyrhizobium lablabi]MBR0696732.1 hypothetical protein [Bradyrhizobium lablabi]